MDLQSILKKHEKYSKYLLLLLNHTEGYSLDEIGRYLDMMEYATSSNREASLYSLDQTLHKGVKMTVKTQRSLCVVLLCCALTLKKPMFCRVAPVPQMREAFLDIVKTVPWIDYAVLYNGAQPRNNSYFSIDVTEDETTWHRLDVGILDVK